MPDAPAPSRTVYDPITGNYINADCRCANTLACSCGAPAKRVATYDELISTDFHRAAKNFATSKFETKDSGQRMEFETGSTRDTEDGKVDWTLVPFRSLRRYAELLMRGAGKYGRHNWRKGQSLSRLERSLARHLMQYLAGESDEDHLAAVVFNAVALMDHEDRIAAGELPSSLDDRDRI